MITLEYGDCLELLPSIPEKSIDMILCDLPYGQTRNEWDCPINATALWAQYKRVITDNGAIVLFGSGRFSASLIHTAGSLYRYSLVWQKTTPTGFLNAKRAPLRSHEDIIVCYKHQPKYNPQMSHGHPRKTSSARHKRNCKQTSNYGKHELSDYDSTDRYPTSVLTFKTDKQKKALHPTQKPVALLEYLIQTYTNEGDTVLDNCMGCGSTAVACMRTGRSFIGMESDATYFRAAKERIRTENKDKEDMDK